MSELNKIVRVMFELSFAKQKEAAFQADIPLSTLNKFLNNSTTLNTDQLVRLLSYLGLDLCEVLRKSVDKDLNPQKSSLSYDIENIVSNLKFDHQKQNLINLLNYSISTDKNFKN